MICLYDYFSPPIYITMEKREGEDGVFHIESLKRLGRYIYLYYFCDTSNTFDYEDKHIKVLDLYQNQH